MTLDGVSWTVVNDRADKSLGPDHADFILHFPQNESIVANSTIRVRQIFLTAI